MVTTIHLQLQIRTALAHLSCSLTSPMHWCFCALTLDKQLPCIWMRHRWRVSRGLWLKPALSLPRSPARFYSAHYFSFALSASDCSFGQAGSVKLAGVGMREQFARSSQRGSQEIIMGGTWGGMHVVRKNNCCSFKNTALIGFTVVGETLCWRDTGTKGLLSRCSDKVARGTGVEHPFAFSCSSKSYFSKLHPEVLFAHSALSCQLQQPSRDLTTH